MRLYRWPNDSDGELLGEVRIPSDEFIERNMLRLARGLFGEAHDLYREEFEGALRLPLGCDYV